MNNTLGRHTAGLDGAGLGSNGSELEAGFWEIL